MGVNFVCFNVEPKLAMLGFPDSKTVRNDVHAWRSSKTLWSKSQLLMSSRVNFVQGKSSLQQRVEYRVCGEVVAN